MTAGLPSVAGLIVADGDSDTPYADAGIGHNQAGPPGSATRGPAGQRTTTTLVPTVANDQIRADMARLTRMHPCDSR